jgi:hypothetical protein
MAEGTDKIGARREKQIITITEASNRYDAQSGMTSWDIIKN